MANVTPADSRSGYAFFRQSGGTASRDEINDNLEGAGYNPISERMYRHYKHLAAAGFDRYISINRFDVARASQPYESLSSNSRYKYARTSTRVRVTFPRGRRLVEAFGKAEAIGETGLILVFDDPPTVRALGEEPTKPRPSEEVRIELLDPPQQFDARIIDIDRTTKLVTIEVEFERLQSIAQFIGRHALPRHQYDLSLTPQDESAATVDLVGRQVYYLFEVLETSRSLVNEAAQLSENDRYAPVTHVRQLSMRSPLYVLLGIPDPVAMVLGLAFGTLSLAITYERWRKNRLQNNSVEVENKVQAAKAELAVAVTEMETQVISSLRKNFNLPDGVKPEDLSSLRQLKSLVGALAEQDVAGAKISRRPRIAGTSDEAG
jgi:hypothetical protein